MFVRKMLTGSGDISVQITEKRSGKSSLIKTAGSSCDPKEVEDMFENGKRLINQIKGQPIFGSGTV